ncbi:MAG: DUF3667 domain-containing protein [Flavobacteriaceae bacterium]|nr:DUF3667 domain-containing protein [Flavobacteriaceae bacterium]
MKLKKIKSQRFSEKYRGKICLNCTTDLKTSHRFCPNCGQKNSIKKISFWDLIQEIFSSVLSYDSKLWHSILQLIKNPGKLSDNYVAGKRARYVNPFRFFLSIAILFFLIASLSINRDEYTDLVDSLNQIDFYEVNQKNQAKQSTKQIGNSIEKLDSVERRNTAQINKDSHFQELNTAQKIITSFEKDKNYTFEKAVEDHIFEDSFSDLISFRFLRGVTKIKNNFIDYMKFLHAKIPFFIFVFIPLFSFFNFLFFWNTKRTYLDHLVFNFNMSSLFILLYGVYKLTTSFLSSKVFVIIFLLAIFIYAFRSIQKFYTSKKISCFFKTLGYMIIYPISLVTFLIISMLTSFMFY